MIGNGLPALTHVGVYVSPDIRREIRGQGPNRKP